MAKSRLRWSAKRCLIHWHPDKQRLRSHTLANTVSELRGIETLNTLSDTVAENEVESLGDKEVEVNAKALDYLNG